VITSATARMVVNENFIPSLNHNNCNFGYERMQWFAFSVVKLMFVSTAMVRLGSTYTQACADDSECTAPVNPTTLPSPLQKNDVVTQLIINVIPHIDDKFIS
jgi:hypothetical protein